MAEVPAQLRALADVLRERQLQRDEEWSRQLAEVTQNRRITMPEVSVPAPIINVAAPDPGPIAEVLSQVVAAVALQGAQLAKLTAQLAPSQEALGDAVAELRGLKMAAFALLAQGDAPRPKRTLQVDHADGSQSVISEK
jgi:hypothetical protein